MSLWTSLEPASLAVDPGGTTTTTVRLRNDGDTVEEYLLTVVGVPAAWATVEPASVRLFPGTRGQATITFSPPRSSEAVAGSAPYGIRIVSRENPALFDVTEGTIKVGAYGDVRADLFPLTVRGRLSGRPRLTVRNLGNSWIDAALGARDDEDVLDFRPIPAVLRVPPGGSATAELRILPRGLRLVRGASRHQYAAAVVPTAAAGFTAEGLPERLEPRGTFVRLPTLPRLLSLLLVLLLIGAVLGSGIYLAALGADGDRADTGRNQAAEQQNQQQNQQDQQNQQQNGGGNAFTITTRGGDQRLTAVDADIVTDDAGRQSWIVTDAGNGTVSLAPSGVDNAALTQGNNGAVLLTQATGTLADQQRWRLDQAGNGRRTIVNAATADCLTTNGDGRRTTVETCADNAADQQEWIFDQG